MLDLLAAMLSGGKATHDIEPDPLAETAVSQIFIAVSPESVGSLEEMRRIADGCIDWLHAAEPVTPGTAPRFPGEGTRRVRDESLRLGVGVEDAVWATFQQLEAPQP